MRILLLADCTSAHTQKWVSGLHAAGIDLAVFSLTQPKYTEFWTQLSDIQLFTTSDFVERSVFSGGVFRKLAYLKVLPALRKAIKSFQPDVVHAHYATSYGLLGALAGFQPYIISVWGSDVFDFPQQHWFGRYLLQYNLRKASRVCSTSQIMARETQLYTDKKIEVVAFGIDTEVFKPMPREATKFTTIGLVKRMEDKYGIRYLIAAFRIVLQKYDNPNLRLLLVGDGVQTAEYQALTIEYGIADKVIFQGLVPFSEVPYWQNQMDIYVSPSILDSESFGVSALEAMACERPVIVSAVGGLQEVVLHNENGLHVPPRNAEALADAILRLLNDAAFAQQLAVSGRNWVKDRYEWRDNVAQMMVIYEEELFIKKKE